MNQRIGHIVSALLLGVLLFFGAMPKDVVHQFAGHQDTRHSLRFGHEGPVLEQQHHHCDYVDLALTPFAFEAYSFEATFHPLPYFHYTAAPVNGYVPAVTYHTALRGPPVS